jgi:hypothetical protein
LAYPTICVAKPFNRRHSGEQKLINLGIAVAAVSTNRLISLTKIADCTKYLTPAHSLRCSSNSARAAARTYSYLLLAYVYLA